MDIEGNWARIKAHRGKLNSMEMQGLAEVLYDKQEEWLEEKLHFRDDKSLAIEILGYLGQSGSAKAANILLNQMESREEVLLVAAADALKQCPPALVLEQLAKIMLRQNQSAIKAGEVLLSFGQVGADVLWRLWFGDNSHSGIKVQILQLLAETKDKRAVPLAFLAFLSEEEELIRTALIAAEKLEAGSLWGNVALCLKNTSWKLRGRAARLLGQWHEKRALAFLREMGADPDPWVEEERKKAMALLENAAL